MTQPSPELTQPPTPQQPAWRLYSIAHDTVYRYSAPVEKSHHTFRLRPIHDRFQEVLEHELLISVPGQRREFDDVFGNHAVHFAVTEPFSELRIESRSVVRVLRSPELVGPDPLPRRVTIPVVWMPWQHQMMLPYLLPPELPEWELHELADYARAFVSRNSHDLVWTLLDMNRTLYRELTYQSGSTLLETTPYEVYRTRRGVCQDFANLLILLARLERVPARYRVGYIHTGADYANRIQSEASHAWVDVYLPWSGWRGLDPTNGLVTELDHIRVAAGRNYRDATPTSGVIEAGGGDETLEVRVRVEVLDEG